MRLTTLACIAATVLALLLPARRSDARCAPGSLSLWPDPGGALPANGTIAVEGSGTEQDFVRGLTGRHPRLLSGRRSVPLEVVAVQEGAFRVTQAILAPASPLEPGRRYVLAVDGRSRIAVWVGEDRRPAAWTAAAEDRTAPTWGSAPRVAPSTRVELGCGPAIFGHVAVAVADGSPVRIRVHVAPEAGGEERVYDVSPEGGDLAIGHGMCSGPFELAAGARYRVTLEAVDAGGNATPAPAGPVTVVGPPP